jgi:hypothetical protein
MVKMSYQKNHPVEKQQHQTYLLLKNLNQGLSLYGFSCFIYLAEYSENLT